MPQFRSAAWMKGLLLLTLMVGGQAGAEIETVTYLHTDHLGSPIMGRDASGNTVFREEYNQNPENPAENPGQARIESIPTPDSAIPGFHRRNGRLDS